MSVTPKHWNLRLHSAGDRHPLVHDFIHRHYPVSFSWLTDLRVAILSTQSIEAYIEEELNHDKADISNRYGRSLHSMSSGERRKAFFDYSMQAAPQALVLDHYFDNMDTGAAKALREELHRQMDNLSIVHIYTRPADALHFIHEKLLYINGEVTADTGADTPAFSATRTLAEKLPPPLDTPEVFTGPLVEFRGVSVSYQDHKILNNIWWTINPGDFWLLRGSNGSGKTTLLSMIAGDNPKAYGQDIVLFGQKKGTGESIWDIKRRIGYFTSNMTFRFWRFQSIRNMIISGFYDSIGLYTIPGHHQIHLANEWLSFMGLTEHAEKPFTKMSDCHRRMVMIARSMVKHPPLLILDEPTADLDEESARLITWLINRIAEQSSTALVYVSHRAEPGLAPEQIYELSPGDEGSVGNVVVREGRGI